MQTLQRGGVAPARTHAMSVTVWQAADGATRRVVVNTIVSHCILSHGHYIYLIVIPRPRRCGTARGGWCFCPRQWLRTPPPPPPRGPPWPRRASLRLSSSSLTGCPATPAAAAAAAAAAATACCCCCCCCCCWALAGRCPPSNTAGVVLALMSAERAAHGDGVVA